MGESQLAIETLDMLPSDSSVARAKAEYLKRVGKMDAAATLLVKEFQSDPSELALLLECTETLEELGRYGEMQRYRLQGLSSVLDDFAVTNPSEFSLPPNRMVQTVMEQRFCRDKTNLATSFYPARSLHRQFKEVAKQDIASAKQAANYTRVEALLLMKFQWSNAQEDFRRVFGNFGLAFQSLILEAISDDDRNLADKLYRVAVRYRPHDIDMAIVLVPHVERLFDKELADQWFDLFYQPMLKHLEEFPDDALVGNNTAWLAANCNRHLDKARDLASKVAVSNPDPTYMDTLAEVEYRLGNIARAIELSEQCFQMEPKHKHHREQLQRFRAGKP
jgi:tetratricopeptide (TPR) repeat protein